MVKYFTWKFWYSLKSISIIINCKKILKIICKKAWCNDDRQHHDWTMMYASNYITERLIKGALFSKRHVKKALVPQKYFLDDWFRNQGKSDSWHYFMSRHVQWLHRQNLSSKKLSAESNLKNPLNRWYKYSGFYGI